jgi:serine-type D-Ala-D-Ala carboxypeptidase (penicillin-binding protein 5/6)
VRRSLVPLALLVALALTGPAAVAAPKPPPPTPVPVPCDSNPSGVCNSPSPFPTALDIPPASRKPPDVSAVSAIVSDLETGQVLFTKQPDQERSLASTTKIMTALLVLQEAEPDEMVRVGPDAAEEGSRGAGFSELGLRLGERLTVEDLLFGLMLQSSNDVAIALADHVSGSVGAFVDDMNARAREMGLRHTVFFSPNGLDDRGHSTAREMAAITRAAMADPEFAEVVGRKFDTIPGPSGGEDRRVQNRNVLLWLYRGSTGVKTGYTSAAGFCLVATAERDGRGVVAVVLGSPTTQDSFDDAAALLDYGFHGYAPHTLVQQGESFAPIPVGTQQIPVEAATGLERLLPEKSGKVARKVLIRKGVSLPVDEGQRLGTVIFSADGLQIGQVPLVAAASVEPPVAEPEETTPVEPQAPEADDGGAAWWLRGLDSITRFGLDTLFGLFG